MNEKLKACRDCKHSRRGNAGSARTVIALAECSRENLLSFSAWNGRPEPYSAPLCVQVNTGEEPCSYFEAKP